MPGVLSATLGIWVGVGSRDESPAVAGSSHFLEHLLFKGTTTRSALEIATAMDAVGGEMNAFTAKEHTCYYANVLASDLPLAVTLLVGPGDRGAATPPPTWSPSARWCSRRSPCATTSPRTPCTTCSPRRCSATPRSAARCSAPSSRSRASPGTTSTAGTAARYAMPSIVVTAAGRVDHQQVLDLVTAAFGDRLGGDARPGAAAARGRRARRARPARPG